MKHIRTVTLSINVHVGWLQSWTMIAADFHENISVENWTMIEWTLCVGSVNWVRGYHQWQRRSVNGWSSQWPQLSYWTHSRYTTHTHTHTPDTLQLITSCQLHQGRSTRPVTVERQCQSTVSTDQSITSQAMLLADVSCHSYLSVDKMTSDNVDQQWHVTDNHKHTEGLLTSHVTINFKELLHFTLLTST